MARHRRLAALHRRIVERGAAFPRISQDPPVPWIKVSAIRSGLTSPVASATTRA
jgi:hypothetical protein